MTNKCKDKLMYQNKVVSLYITYIIYYIMYRGKKWNKYIVETVSVQNGTRDCFPHGSASFIMFLLQGQVSLTAASTPCFYKKQILQERFFCLGRERNTSWDWVVIRQEVSTFYFMGGTTLEKFIMTLIITWACKKGDAGISWVPVLPHLILLNFLLIWYVCVACLCAHMDLRVSVPVYVQRLEVDAVVLLYHSTFSFEERLF